MRRPDLTAERPPPEAGGGSDDTAGAQRRLAPHAARVVYRAALLTAVPLLAVVVIACALPRDYYTGTDSVRTRAFVQPVAAHQTLCVPGLRLPAETGRVQFEILTGGPTQPPLRLTLRTADGTTTSRLPERPAPPSTRTKVAFTIPARPSSPASVPATACVTPSRLVNFGGTVNIGGTAPTLDGAPRISRIAVWFLPPAGERRSFFAQFPSVVERAALFRPGVVGPWTYVVLLLLVLPGTGIAAIRLLARAGGAAPWRLAAGVYAVAFLVAASWALVTPPFQAPDEPDHFAYVEHLAQTGKAPSQSPVPGLNTWSDSEANAITHTRVIAANEQADGRPPWLRTDEHAWEASTYGADLKRDNGGGPTTSATHGPVYYGVVSGAYVVTERASIWSQLTVMRLLSAALGALAALFGFLTARELWPRPLLFAVAAGLLVAFQPMYGFISGSVNNDVGINAAAAAAIFLLVRVAMRRAPLIATIALGVLIGILPVIKGTGYELYPLAIIAAIGTLLRSRSRPTFLALGLGLAAVVAMQLLWSGIAPNFGRSTYTTPGGQSPVASSGLLAQPGTTLSYLWQVLLPRLPFMADHFVQTWPFFNIYIVRGFASFGWYTIEFPRGIYAVVVAVLAALLVLGVLAAWRERAWVRQRWLELAILALAPVGVIAAVESAYATTGIRPVLAEMGRYAFPAITAVAVLAIGATFGAGRRRAATVATVLVAAEMVLAYASVLLTLAGFYT